MVILPGDHVLDTNITVANVARLTLHGESSSGNRATVVCNVPVGLSFTSIVDFKIRSLTFTNCSRNYSVPLVSNYALLLQSLRYAEFVNCSFHDNLGTALVVDNTTISLTGNSEFTHNHCESNSCTGGGGITALSSNLTFTGNTIFLLNNAISVYSYGGGAIYASHNTIISFNGTSNFINNSAHYGGAIYTSSNTVLSFNGSNNFVNNSADYNGGAIYTFENAKLSFNGTSNFINNLVHFAGGAIYTLHRTVLSFTGTNNFTGNSANRGGAIYTQRWYDVGSRCKSEEVRH